MRTFRLLGSKEETERVPIKEKKGSERSEGVNKGCFHSIVWFHHEKQWKYVLITLRWTKLCWTLQFLWDKIYFVFRNVLVFLGYLDVVKLFTFFYFGITVCRLFLNA